MIASTTPTGQLLIDGHTINIDAPGAVGTPEAAAALALIPAMHADGILDVDGEIDPIALANFREVADVFATWAGKRPPQIRPGGVRQSKSPAGGVATFFSGGVDSMFTATTAPDVEALIFVHGFDIQLEQRDLREQASEHARKAAASLGKELVEVVTDMRGYSPINGAWGLGHGAAMASVAHSLADRFGKVYIPATYTYADATFPWGSHPLTDPMWSTDRVQIVHHGAATTRFEKIGALVDNPAAQQNLRVCWENRGGRFNCGRCEKCTRTMIALRAHGRLERFVTFDEPLKLSRVRLGEINHETQAAFTRQGIAATSKSDPALAAALRWRLRLGHKLYMARMARNKIKRKLRLG